ncbi:DNA-processing protein DprA [Salipiger bermudensis]|uniref:DNA-processing protein DprA n=1 Tax=Salipiger bermudensis TaxID=344736 RepID=UPI001C995695|nr:DNA-processing protein DprA [Salipiger bermudensis]MBY6002652.1 DNA-processing protein DprA [Salipiger bermudensis]
MTEDSNSSSSTHPPLPPPTEEDRFERLRLLRSRRVGVATYWRLLAEHGSAAAALEALPGVAAAAGVENYSICPERVVQSEITAARRHGARLVCLGELGYPPLLAALPDPPPFLWVAGELDALMRPAVALVGARNASSLGTRMARALAKGLGAEGRVVVSGLARGVDAAAHEAALETGTVAVMAGGVDILYPSENIRLGEEIRARGGALVSEHAMGLHPQARHFPARNRIVSGISAAIVVVEAAAKSGSLITARCALDQGREVLAVPGHPLDARAAGCNMLIRDGARLVRHAEDVAEALGPLPPAEARQQSLPLEEPPAQGQSPAPETRRGAGERPAPGVQQAPPQIPAPPPKTRSLAETALLHRQILDRLGPAPLAEDQLIRDLAAPSDAVAPALTDLEIDGRIRRQPGGLLSLV